MWHIDDSGRDSSEQFLLKRRDFILQCVRRLPSALDVASETDTEQDSVCASLRSEVCRVFDDDCYVDRADDVGSPLDIGLHTLLKGLLALKLSNSTRDGGYTTKPILVGWCACDIFLHAIALLLRHEKYNTIYIQLSRPYLCGDRRYSSEKFSVAFDNEKQLQEFAEFVISHTDVTFERLIEAELLVYLYHFLKATQDKSASMWNPRLYRGSQYLFLDFFHQARIASFENARKNLLACLGLSGKSEAYDQLCTDMQNHLNDSPRSDYMLQALGFDK